MGGASKNAPQERESPAASRKAGFVSFYADRRKVRFAGFARTK